MRGVALGGFMGTGKTTVGRGLATRLELPFADTDAMLEERYGPIAEQFAEQGERVFRAREHAIVVELCGRGPMELATGGGAWVDPRNRRALATCCVRVVLHAPLATLRQRLGDAPGRPLWKEAESLLAAREPAYADADLRIDVGGRSVEAIVEGIVVAMGQHGWLAGHRDGLQ